MYESMRDLLSQHKLLVTHQTSDPNYVGIRVDHLKELWELAHDAVHPPEEPDEAEENIERGYDQTQLRMQCLSLATQVDLGRMHAAKDGQWSSDPVGLAEAYYAFLKGDGEVTP